MRTAGRRRAHRLAQRHLACRGCVCVCVQICSTPLPLNHCTGLSETVRVFQADFNAGSAAPAGPAARHRPPGPGAPAAGAGREPSSGGILLLGRLFPSRRGKLWGGGGPAGEGGGSSGGSLVPLAPPWRSAAGAGQSEAAPMR